MLTICKLLNTFAAFVAGLLGGTFIILSFFYIYPNTVSSVYDNHQLLRLGAKIDVISIANTYIVFTTFIFVTFTILMGALGMWFAKWFSVTKEKEIRENMRDFFKAIDSDSVLAEKFVKGLLEREEISDRLQKLVVARVEEEIKARESEGAPIDFKSDTVDGGDNDES